MRNACMPLPCVSAFFKEFLHTKLLTLHPFCGRSALASLLAAHLL